jgi:hypothetical protein
MKFRNLLAIPLLALAVSPALFADHVTVDYNHAASFSQLKTYSWSSVHTANSIWDQRVKDAIDKALAAKGWTQVPDGGNVALVAVEKTSIQQQYNTFYDGFGGFGGRRRGGMGMGMSTTSVDNYKVGTLIVSMLDPNSRQLIWRGTSSGDLSGNPKKDTKNLDKDVQKMFKHFPPNKAA